MTKNIKKETFVGKIPEKFIDVPTLEEATIINDVFYKQRYRLTFPNRCVLRTVYDGEYSLTGLYNCLALSFKIGEKEFNIYTNTIGDYAEKIIELISAYNLLKINQFPIDI